MKVFLAAGAVLWPLCQAASATEFRFASKEEAAAILTADDDFLTRLRPAEISVRLMSEETTSLSALKAQYAAGTLAWNDQERSFLSQAVEAFRPAFEKYAPLAPAEILFIKGDDLIDGGLPHTRANAIFFSESFLRGLMESEKKDEEAAYFLLHEYFHVVSREQEARLDEMLALIGFRPCDLEVPASLSALHLTNPDAPTDRHYAPAGIDGADGVVPYLYVDEGGWSAEKGGSLSKYFNFGLLAVDVSNGACVADLDAEGAPRLLSPDETPGFWDTVGRNTNYIIHPAEILADTFVFLVTDKKDLPNPEIVAKLSDWLDGALGAPE